MKRSWITIAMLATLGTLTPSLFAQAVLDADVPFQTRQEDSRVAREVSLAYSLHELALLYIEKGEAEKGLNEARRLLALDLPVQFETHVVESMAILANSLGEKNRFDLGQTLLDETLKTTEQPGNRARLLKTKARLYRMGGDDDKAIESWRRAIELEERIPRQTIPK